MLSQGLRTVIYRVPDLAQAKAWYSAAFGVLPYFEEPFYVGFNIGGYELGLLPAAGGPAEHPVEAYWGVADVDAAFRDLLQKGGQAHSPVTAVGGGIRVATVTDPFGNLIGIIENPHFQAQESPAAPAPDHLA